MPTDLQPTLPEPARGNHDNETVVPGRYNADQQRDAGPGPAGVADLDEFVRTLVELGLIGDTEQSAFPVDSAEGVLGLSRALVKAGKLTPYQAAAIYQKKSRGLLVGNYIILDKLGQGGMGVVFKARHRRLGRVGALKILPPSFARDRDAVMRFRREVEAAGRLKHPNLVAAQDADEDRGVHFLVMDFVAGGDLDRIVRDSGPMEITQAIDCLIQAARGLEAAHAQGIVHRDIKPANLMLDKTGTIRVLDLGLARIVDAANPFGKSTAGRLTQSGMYMGTIDYMAPEQAEDSHRVDHRADIYSLGCTLCYLLTGKEPFTGETMLKKLMAHMERPAASLRVVRPQVPAAIDAAYLKMMAKRPEDRPASMTEVVALLQAARNAPEYVEGGSPETKPGLTGISERKLKRAGDPMPKSDPSILLRPQEPGVLSLGDELSLEDLVMDVRPAAPPTNLPPLPKPAPARIEPLRRAATAPSRNRSRRARSVLVGLLAIAALGAAFLGMRLFSGPASNTSEPAGTAQSASKARTAQPVAKGSAASRASGSKRDEPDPRGTVPVNAQSRALNLGFETGTLADWTAEGDAFKGQPINGDSVQMRGRGKSGNDGKFWVGTFEIGGDEPKGRLTSAPFRVSKPFASFLVGGGSHQTTCVELVRSDTQQVVFRVSGKDREDLERVVADLSAHQGKEIVIRLVDLESGSWGHINFDEFRLHETKPAVTPAPPLPPVITAKRATAAATSPAKTVTPPGTAATTTTPTRPNFVRSYPMRQWVLIGSERRSGIIPEEAASVMDDLAKKGAVVKWFSFTPTGGWTILHDRHGIFCRNVGDESYKELSELQHKRVELKSITYAPTGAWVILYGRNFFSSSPNVPPDVLKELRDARVRGEELKSIAFAPSGGCVVLSGRNNVFVSGSIPDTARNKLTSLRNERQDLKSMAFTPSGGWTILVNFNGSWVGPNVDREVLNAAADLSHGEFKCLNFAVPKLP